MKWLFGFLALASLSFFAFIQWGSTSLEDSKTIQSQPPLNAEKIKLLPTDISPISFVSPISSVSAVMPVSSVSSVQPTVKIASTCIEWGNFPASDFTRVSTALSTLQLGNTLMQRQAEHTIGYWVYLPPMGNSAAVTQKIAQIKKLGLADYFVIQDEGKFKNAISLGVFKTVEAAHKFSESIIAKGLDSAKVGERTSKGVFTVFVLRDPSAEIMSKISTLQKSFPDSEIKAAACR